MTAIKARKFSGYPFVDEGSRLNVKNLLTTPPPNLFGTAEKRLNFHKN